MSDAKGSEEPWVGVKSQTNPEIAGSPRNALTRSLGGSDPGVKSLEGPGAPARPQPIQTLKPGSHDSGSETVGVKLHRREGNSPDHRLTAPKSGPSVAEKGGGAAQTARRWALSSHPPRSVSQLTGRAVPRPQWSGAKPGAEAVDAAPGRGVVGERWERGEGRPARAAGAVPSANAGTSSVEPR